MGTRARPVPLTVGLALVGWAAGWAAAGKGRRLPAADTNSASPKYTVVVPARNEARRLPRLLQALQRDGVIEPVAVRQPAAERRVIIVDDASTDGTAELAASAGAEVLHVDAPEGWTGKAWACWQGAQAADGDVVVFLDADTEPSPQFLSRLCADAVSTGGLVSVQPLHVTSRPYERASAVCNVVALMAGTGTFAWGAPRAARQRWWRDAIAFGPAVAVVRERYLAAGGHALVRADIADDLALAHALSRRGIPVSAYADAGEGSIVYRMYPEGARSLVEGWTKNLAAGARAVPPARAALVAAWVTGGFAAIAAPWCYALYVAQCAVLMRRAGRFGAATAIAYPLPMASFAALTAASALTRRPRWRGRVVTP